MTIDKTLADEAIQIVTGARNKAYDAPERNFARIALAWEAITDRKYTASEVALMFVALKIVRESHQHQRDNLVDGIGYLLCAGDVTPEPAVWTELDKLRDAPTPPQAPWYEHAKDYDERPVPDAMFDERAGSLQDIPIGGGVASSFPKPPDQYGNTSYR